MHSIIKRIYIPIIAAFIFVLGNGLFTTFLAVYLGYKDASSLFIGALSGFFFAGLAFGSFQIEKYILRVGHIRAFSAFASLLCVLILLQGMIANHSYWLIFRFLSGFAAAGIFVVIESWLLAVGTLKTRGQVLALYLISIYAAQIVGQLMLNIGDPKTKVFFTIAAMLSALAVIPMALTKIPSPEITKPSTLKFKKLIEISSSTLIGSFCSGLILGSIYGLLPLVILEKMQNTRSVTIMMSLVILGGMLLQYPVGRVSDMVDRRKLLLILACLVTLVSFLMMSSFHYNYAEYITAFFLGGMIFTIYPVSISYACDNLDPEDIVSGTQSFLLVNAIGAAVGPMIAPLFMLYFGLNGFFIFLIFIGFILAGILFWRTLKKEPAPQETKFIAIPHTTAVSVELDPRTQN